MSFTLILQTRSLIGIEVVASIQVRADGVVVFEAPTDDSRFTVIAFLKTTCNRDRHKERLILDYMRRYENVMY